MKDLGSLTGSEDQGKDIVEYLSLLHICYYQFTLLICQRGHTLLRLSFLANVPLESLPVILCIPCQAQFYLCLGFPDPIPVYPDCIPVLFPGHVSPFPLPVHFLLVPQFDHQILAQMPQLSALPTHFLMQEDEECLCSKENILKELPALIIFFGRGIVIG